MELSQQVQGFEEFFQDEYYDELLENARTDERRLVVEFSKLAQHNPDLASELLDQPEEVLKAAEMSLKSFDLPEGKGPFFIRFRGLPTTQHLMIRDVRAKHLGKFLEIEGIVRQKSDVRPQVVSARFECPSCGNIIPVLQLEQKMREPTRCACGRKGKFRLLDKTLVDAQKIVLEEAPEDLEGGEQPKRLNIFLKNDLVSPMSDKQTNPGARIGVTGVIKEVPITLQQGGTSVRFDLMLEANYVEPKQEDYSQIEITEEEEQKIQELANDPQVFAKLTASIAPSIYGHEKVKEALVLQLLGGVMKKRDKGGVKTRGDIHILLIGDPGAGKCVAGDTLLQLADGTIQPIAELFAEEHGSLVEEHAYTTQHPITVLSLGLDGKEEEKPVTTVWRRSAKDALRITLRSGGELVVTPDHPFFTSLSCFIISVPARELLPGTPIATPRKLTPRTSLQPLSEWRRSRANNTVHLTPPPEATPWFGRLLGYLAGDGWVGKRMLSVTNNDEEVLADVEQLLRQLGTHPTRRQPHAHKQAFEVYTTSSELLSFIRANAPELARHAGEKHVPRLIQRSPNAVVREFLKALFECDAHVSPRSRSIQYVTKSKRLALEVRLLLLRFGIKSQLHTKPKRATNSKNPTKHSYYEVVVSGEDATRYGEAIGFVTRRKTRANQHTSKHNTNKDTLPGLAATLRLLRRHADKTIQDLPVAQGSYRHYERGNRHPSRAQARRILESYDQNHPLLAAARQFVDADIFWDEVVKVERVTEPIEVYDLEVKQNHNFVANCAYIHNSQLLKRVSYVAPKARFVSGKGASGAGLTASVVKDEFLKGWALEAGALVLANKGIACLDELDKMSPEDRSAMHEALEQQTVTISKANIQATLRAETTVLAAANPKFGRFDPYELLAKQIDLPSTLINRFDLIFPIRDLPNREKDEQLASFILKLHQDGESREGPVDAEFLRKYISYAKQRIKPHLTQEALEEIKAYYMKMRTSGGEGEEAIKAIPISARQLEALIRLTEASARSRLSKEATKKDAKVAIDLVHYTLSAIGLDPTTGKFDIDRITTGITASQRSTIAIIKEVVTELEQAIGKVIPIEDVVREAEIKGIKEDDVHETLEKLKRAGDLFSPKQGFISKI